MKKNRKGRTGWHRWTLTTSICKSYFSGLTSKIKDLIITLTLWGLIPVKLANWIINLGGANDE